MEVTPRPTINLDDIEEDNLITHIRKARLQSVIPELTEEERIIIRSLRCIQLRKIYLTSESLDSTIEEELIDPDPYKPFYIFYCLRLKGKSV
jgi:hypothetical protein